MFVRHRMTSPAITTGPDMPVMDALQFMRDKGVRRLPVVDGEGRLLGIVSEKDLLHAAPSSATTLSIFEMSYLLHRLTVGRIMTKDVVTVEEDTPLEVAARIMAEKHLGGLPVMRDGRVIGLITETDILLGFSEVLGAFQPGVRLMLHVPDEPGVLATVSQKVTALGGNIASLTVFPSREPKHGYVVLRVQGAALRELTDSLDDGRIEVLDARLMTAD
jgi:acetoin utilization protein AcuB